MQPSEEIKAKLDIVDVVRDYIPLKAAGVNFRACCPFHKEKSPSFVVSPEKQIFHCFGCGKGGDIFSFVTQIEGIEFVEALRMLAQKAGVTLQRIDPKINSEKNKILDIIDLSRKYFHHVLRNDKGAQAARDYLKKRGLKDETIDEWQIGYSLDSWDGLLKALLARGYKEPEILKAGMIIKKENTNKYYDRFRDRIMFPINDVNGSTVAFTARINPEKEATDKMGKYINSPQTMVYDKSKILFGLDKAKLAIKASDSVVITEGQMDVISSHQAGFNNVVASSGTALTTEQIILIKRFTNNISLAFDQDAAGAMAADRGIREAMQADMNIKVVEIPNGKDPDECVKNNPADFERAIKNAKAMMQYYFDITLGKINTEELEGKREAVKKLLPIITKLGSPIDQDFWLRRLAEKINVKEDVLQETIKRSKGANQNRPEPNRYQEKVLPDAPKTPEITRAEKLSELLLSLLLKFSPLLEYASNNIQVEHIVGSLNKGLYRSLIIYYNNTVNQTSDNGSFVLTYNEFKQWLIQETGKNNNDQLAILDKLVILGDKDYYDQEIEEIKVQAIQIRKELSRHFLKNRMLELEQEISRIENSSKLSEEKSADVQNLMEEFRSLSEELKRVNQ